MSATPLVADRFHDHAATGRGVLLIDAEASSEENERVVGGCIVERVAPRPQDRFTVSDIKLPSAGDYAVQVRYHNGANQVNMGISGGVKWLALKDESGRIVAQGVVQLPHARIEKANTPTVYSTPLAARLKANVAYRIEMSDFYNMSYLDSNRSFSAAGGVDGPSNRFDVYGVRLLRTNGTK